jgi:hypothetical protein
MSHPTIALSELIDKLDERVSRSNLCDTRRMPYPSFQGFVYRTLQGGDESASENTVLGRWIVDMDFFEPPAEVRRLSHVI